ncbi:MAG: LAGLIDADG family homing endonuclease, partial [Halobacteriaceae archaeon]
YLVNYGEFVENNHPLAPAGYTVEWWTKDLAAAGADVQALEDAPHVDLADPTPAQALAWATDHDAPLHPEYTYLWHDIAVEQFRTLADAVADGEVRGRDRRGRADGGAEAASARADDDSDTLVLEDTPAVREILEALLVEHTREEGIEIRGWRPLARSLGVTEDLDREWETLPAAARTHDGGENAVEAVNAVAPFEVRERAPTRVGCRMGRPEKSEERELSPAVHTLFPIGEAGGDQRDVAAAAGEGEVTVDLGERACPDCGDHTFRARCPACGAHTHPHYECDDCGVVCEPDEAGRVECPRCGREVTAARPREVDLGDVYGEALDAVGERAAAFDVLKGVKGLTSADKVPEPVEKGVLRAKHGVSAFKDGTVRYDMTDLPVTAVRPDEIGVSPGALRALGYDKDIHGEPLRHDDQLVHLKVQDVVLSEGAADHLLSTADFVDDLLGQYYGLEPFYEADEREDLVGELVFGMAPHTSAAVVGRVVGFTSAAAGYAHPYFHASKRRNCFHPDTKVWYETGGEWRHAPIEELVETHLDEATAEVDDFGTLVDDPGEVFVPSLAGGAFVRKPVEAVSRHPAPDHLVRVETAGGRELTVTPDHEVHVFDGDGVVGKRASALSPEDQLVTPAGLDVEAALDPPEFDLLAEFLAVEEIDDDRLMVRGIDKEELYDRFEAAFADDSDGEFHPLQSTADRLGLTKTRLSNYLYRESVPVSLLRDCFDSEAALLDWVPEGVSLGMRRDSAAIDRVVAVNERVATLLGYYAAEGFARAQETPKGTVHQTTVCGTEAAAREFFVATLAGEFGVDPYEENDAKVTASGRLLRAFVDTVLDAGVAAAGKRVPQCVFDAPEEIVAAYLRGYFSGDETVPDGSLAVGATTVSRELKEDLLALLTRLGITARAERRDPVPLHEKFPGHYDADDPSMSAARYVLTISSEDAMRFAERVGVHLDRKADVLAANASGIEPSGRRALDGGDGEYLVDSVAAVEYVPADTEHTYCLTVPESNSLVSNDISSKQCDGDEDCVMLLMDGLLNFSESYLPDKRGGRMDAPLVMTSRIDPAEIDDEAHNVDIVEEYPREFYEATRELADPGEVDIRIAEDTLGTEAEYDGFAFTHDTSHIAGGPDLSAYKTLESMTEKMDAQLELARTLRAVDETDVAERVIEYHFLPDLIGNLRAFARQETRCLDCGEKFRRVPLSGACRECGGDVTLTVHEGSVNKYLDTALEVAETYGCREYTKQRLDILERSIESVFENDQNKQSGFADFM